MRRLTLFRIAGLLALSVMAVIAAEVPLDVPLFHQEKNGCGAAAVAMVMHYWSGHYTLPAESSPDADAVYQSLSRNEMRGIRLADMRDYARDHGFPAFAFRGTVADLETQVSRGRPIVVGLRKKPGAGLHYAVLVGLAGDYVWLNDPGRKKTTRMKRSKFEKRWRAADRWLLLVAPMR